MATFSLILIVDDESECRKSAGFSLPMAAQTVEDPHSIGCGFGKAALAAFRVEAPNCILLDRRPLDVDGLEFLERLKERAEALSAPVAVLIGSLDTSPPSGMLRGHAQDNLLEWSIGPEVPLRAARPTRDGLSLPQPRAITDLRESLASARAETRARKTDLSLSEAALASSRAETRTGLNDLLASAVALASSQKETQNGLTRLLASAAALSASQAETQGGQAELLASAAVNKALSRANEILVASDATIRETETRLRKDIAARETTQHDLEEAVAGHSLELAEASMLRDEAKHLNQVKSEFLANMSHEIRTPMNGIIGMTDLLLRTKLDVGQRRFADAVHLSADALLKLVNNVLDISKLESGKVELEEIDFKIADCIASTVGLLKAVAEARGISIAAYVDPMARRMLRGDPTRLGQLLQNLLSNAVKFTDHGGIELKVSGRLAEQDRLALRIEVQDTGCGFDDMAKGKLFQKFQQGDGSITRRFGGSGLGLALCRQIVTLMGGEIGAESDPGQGSLFWVEMTLPLGSEQAVTSNAGSRVLRGLRALVVDDNEVDRVVFEQYLVGEAMEVATAADGKSAIDIIQGAFDSGKLLDVVVVGDRLLDMTGPELARSLHVRFGDQAPALIMVSGLDGLSRSDPDRALFQARLNKPLRGVDLVACVVRTLAGPGRGAAGDKIARSRAHAASVLFVDDNEVNRLLGVTLLEQAGYTVETANDGVQALAAVKQGSFGLVFMDIQMPNMDGLEATKAIRGLPDGKSRLPIVAVTANAMVGNRETYLRAGMSDYLSKPLDVNLLLGLAQQWTGFHRTQIG